MGFPCQDISVVGRHLGLDGSRSSLVFEALRLCDETGCAFIFMENVANIRKMPSVWQPLFDALGVRGFALRWCTVSASNAGAPQRRARWFALAQRGGGFEQRPDALPDDLLPPFSGQSGVKFNGGRPPPGRWLLPREEHPRVCERLNMLGNAVVPLQAHLAARLLQFEWRWALACLRCRNEHFLGAAPRHSPRTFV